MSTLVSIIVPIYNKEKYLERSLKSILNQSYNNFEVWLVDDGSDDSSGMICQKFCKLDSRFFYIYKENGGVASARNVGLAHATGEYIGFVDPDDYIDKDMFGKLIEIAESAHADVVGCGVKINDNDRYMFNCLDGCINSEEAIYHLLMWDNKISTYLWNKLFNRKIIQNLKFEEDLSVGEDIPFVFESLCNSSTYAHTNECLYTYVRNEDSLTGIRYNSKVSRNSIQASNIIVKYTQIKYKKYIYIAKYSLFLNAYFQITKIFHDKNGNQCYDDFVFFKDIIINTPRSVVKQYGNFITMLKVFGAVKMPKTYRMLQKMMYIWKDYYYC